MIKLRFWVLAAVVSALSFNSFAAAPKYQSLKQAIDSFSGDILVDMAWVEPVSFQGHLDPGTVDSKPRNVAYQDLGIGAAGPALQIIAQAIGSKSARKRKYENMQAAANQVLDSHLDNASALTIEDLYFRFKTMLAEQGHSVTVFTPVKNKHNYYLQLDPVFTLSQDQKGLMLKNTIKYFKGVKRKKLLFKQDFIVVSNPIENVDEFWNIENGNNLLSLSFELFDQSVQLLLAQLSEEPLITEKQKTFRYKFGDTLLFERAAKFELDSLPLPCDRVSVVNLGKGLMNLPQVENNCSDELLEAELDLATDNRVN